MQISHNYTYIPSLLSLLLLPPSHLSNIYLLPCVKWIAEELLVRTAPWYDTESPVWLSAMT